MTAHKKQKMLCNKTAELCQVVSPGLRVEVQDAITEDPLASGDAAAAAVRRTYR